MSTAQNSLAAAKPSGSANDDDATRREREFFDRLVSEQGDFNPFLDRGWRTLARRFREMIAPAGQLKLLDIGCGTGQSRQIYCDPGISYTGVDLASAAIAVAKTRFPGSEWQVGNACHLQFADDQFDVVAFSSVLHHIPDYSQALREALRVLRPGGHVFAFDPNILHPAMALFRYPRSLFHLSKGASPDERPLFPFRLANAFRRAGFVKISQRCQSDLPYREVASPWMNVFLKFYNAADWLMEITRLGRIFGTFVITCGRKPVNSATNI